MYTLGENWNSLFSICYEGLRKDPDNKLLKDVMSVLSEYDKKHGIEYKVGGFTIRSSWISTSLKEVEE